MFQLLPCHRTAAAIPLECEHPLSEPTRIAIVTEENGRLPRGCEDPRVASTRPDRVEGRRTGESLRLSRETTREVGRVPRCPGDREGRRPGDWGGGVPVSQRRSGGGVPVFRRGCTFLHHRSVLSRNDNDRVTEAEQREPPRHLTFTFGGGLRSRFARELRRNTERIGR